MSVQFSSVRLLCPRLYSALTMGGGTLWKVGEWGWGSKGWEVCLNGSAKQVPGSVCRTTSL